MKTVIVTGSSGGIGSAIARKFASEGWFVIASYRDNKESAECLFKDILTSGGNCCIQKTDITDPAKVEELIKTAEKETGRLDALVNCAGVSLLKPVTETTYDEIKRVIDTDLCGTIVASKEAAKIMIREHSGVIINISSMWGKTGASCETVYSAAKAGVIGFTRALALELAPSGIRVNCVCPGFIDTKMNDKIDNNTADYLIRSTPLGRKGRAEEVADAVFFLAGNSSSFITGENISVDGGFTL